MVRSRPGIRRASMEAATRPTHPPRRTPSRPGIRRASMEAEALQDYRRESERVTARYSPGQHGSNEAGRRTRVAYTSRPGIRRASMEARHASRHRSTSPRSRPGIRRASMEAGRRCGTPPASRAVTARYSPGAAPRCVPVTARYSPGQHGSSAVWKFSAADVGASRPGIRRASMEALVTARYSPGQHGSMATLGDRRRVILCHGPVFAGPAWKPGG